MITASEREPSLSGAPRYFQCCIAEAEARTTIGLNMKTRKVTCANYANAGYQLAIHVEDYLSEAALEALCALSTERYSSKFNRLILEFFDKEFPGCMALVPPRRRSQFLKGIFRAMEDGRFPIERE